MKITRENYETWFLDYLEGSLDQGEREEVHRFLLKHPDLADELESYSPVPSLDADLKYPFKELLKKSPYDDSAFFDNMVIAGMEGDLTAEEAAEFNNWLSDHPFAQEYISGFKKLRLQPDLSIHFPQKEHLKKKSLKISLLYRVTAVAAILLLAFLLFKPSGQKQESAQLSVNTIVPAEKEVKPAPEAGKMNSGVMTEKETMTAMESTSLQKTTKIPGKEMAELPVSGTRQSEPVMPLKSRTIAVQTDIPAYYDLMPVRMDPINYASGEIPLSEYYDIKLQSLKDQDPKGFITREEVAVAGLRFFSRLTGNHLTGKKGKDGNLKSISFNSQPLAISIPVNR